MSEAQSSDQPVLYLHCGAFKTATSSIQSFGSIHRETLLRDYGILYPLAGGRVNAGVGLRDHPDVKSYGHHLLVHHGLPDRPENRKGRRFRATVGAIRKEFEESGARKLFLSCELLTSCGAKLRRMILTEFSGFRIRILYSVRHAADYHESMNNQILSVRKEIGDSGNPLPFLRNLDAWSAELGHENIRVFVFAPSRFPDYIREFFDALETPGLTSFASGNMPKVNGSLSLEGIHILDLLNSFLPPWGEIKHPRRQKIDLMVNDINGALSRRTPLITLDASERAAIDRINRPEMEELVRRYLKPGDEALLVHGADGRSTPAKNLGDSCSFSSGDLRMIHENLTRTEIVKRMPFNELLEGRLQQEVFSDAELREIFSKLQTSKRKKRKLVPHGEKERTRKGAGKNLAGVLPRFLFHLVNWPVVGGVLLSLPPQLRRRCAEILSRRGYDAQAVTLDPNPSRPPLLRAGIHTPFASMHPDFSGGFTLLQGMAWLGCRGDRPPSAANLVEWLAQLPVAERERGLAFLCQIRTGKGFAKELGALLPSGIGLPEWFTGQALPAESSPFPVHLDMNLNLLAINRLKGGGHVEAASRLQKDSFRVLGLSPPPADLFNGYSPELPEGDAPPDPAFPRITVIVCAWQAERFLPVALASILNQTYPNLEIIAIDDASADGTHRVMQHWLGGRRNAVVIRNEQNLGAYGCRNLGLQRASGDHVMFHDADDWSEPHKVMLQWRALSENRGALAASSDWFRVDERTGLCFARRVYPICRWNCSSFLFARRTALGEIGFYDSVRTGADSEYVARFEAVFGKHRHIRLRLPLSIGLEHGGSLTGSPDSGFGADGLSSARQSYLEAWRTWHAAGWNKSGGLRLAAGDRIPG